MTDETTVRREALPMQRYAAEGEERKAPFRVGSFDAEQRTIDLVWTTGARVSRTDWFTGKRYEEELVISKEAIDMKRLNGGAPLLNSHSKMDLRDVIGVVEKAWIDGNEGHAKVRFSTREDVQPIIEDVRNGIIRNVSVGYAIRKIDVMKEEGKPDLYRVTKWEPMELSLVPIGADASAGTRSADSAFDCEITQRAAPETQEAKMAEVEKTVAPVVDTREVEKKTEPEVKTEVRVPDVAEYKRVAKPFGKSEKDILDVMTRKVSPDAWLNEMLDEAATRTEQTHVGGHNVQILNDERQTTRDLISEAITHRLEGKGELSQGAREYRYMPLTRIMEDVLLREGNAKRGMSQREMVERAMHSTSDFPQILANVASKRLSQAYQAAPKTYQVWATKAPNLPDFKDRTIVQMGEAPDLAAVAEGGEFTYGTFTEAKTTYKAFTYGKILSFSRQMLINDDLRAFDRMTSMYAVAAARLENTLVYQQLTGNPAMQDTVALFHSTHGNLAASGGAISLTTLSAGRTAMRLQKGLNAVDYLNLSPTWLLVPATKEGIAYQQTSNAFTPAVQTNINEFANGGRSALSVVVDSFLDTVSTTAWYLVANAGAQPIDTVEYCYLDGSEGLYLENRIGFNTDGMEIKARLDFATKVLDWKGLFKDPGA